MSGKHRAPVRPRWGRIGLSAAAASVVVVAIIGGAGAFSHSHSTTLASDTVGTAAGTSPGAAPSGGTTPQVPTPRMTSHPSASTRDTRPATTPAVPSTSGSGTGSSAGSSAGSSTGAASSGVLALPPGSGTGRRAVFSQSEQRVWIVGADGEVARTYPVSGSTEDNLLPGTYAVYSRSRWAIGVDDSGDMQYFVRFTHGTDTGAAIGFHSIPTKDGKPLQTIAQLGTPLSHGCIRQKTADAIAMWDFAQVGTKVVVVA